MTNNNAITRKELEALIPFASDDCSRPTVNALRFDPNATNGKSAIVATDGKAMAYVNSRAFTIGGKLSLADAKAAKAALSTDGSLDLTEADDGTHVASHGGLTLTLDNGIYPPWVKALPERLTANDHGGIARVNVRYLAKVVAAAKKLGGPDATIRLEIASDTSKGSPKAHTTRAVAFEVYPDERTAKKLTPDDTLEAMNSPVFRAVVMPLISPRWQEED